MSIKTVQDLIKAFDNGELSNANLKNEDIKDLVKNLKDLKGRDAKAEAIRRQFRLISQSQMSMSSRGIEKVHHNDSIPYRMLRDASKKIVLLGAIHKGIERGLKQLAKPANHNEGIGFEIVHKYHNDPDFQPDTEELEEINEKCKQITEFFESPDPVFAPSLDEFFTKILKDHLEIDRCAIGITYDNNDDVIALTPIDGATIKPIAEYVSKYIDRNNITSSGTRTEKEIAVYRLSQEHGRDIREYAWVQDSGIGDIRYFREDEIVVGVDNPRTELGYYGHGRSYVEIATQAIIAFAYSFTHNLTQYEEGVLPEGLISIIGDLKDEGMAEIEAELRGRTSQRPEFKERTPVLQFDTDQAKEGAGVKWVPLKPSNKDMLFNQWLHFVTALTASIYGYPMDKLQLSIDGSGRSVLINTREDVDSRRIKNYEYIDCITTFLKNYMDRIVRKFDDNLRWKWKGIKEHEESKQLDIHKKQGDFKSLNEIRALMGGSTLAESLDKDVQISDDLSLKEIYEIVGNFVLGQNMAQLNHAILQAFLNEKMGGGAMGGFGGMGGEGSPEGMGAEGEDEYGGDIQDFDFSQYIEGGEEEVEKTIHKILEFNLEKAE